MDYGPAIEYLKWGTYHTLDDKPTTYSSGQQMNNWDRKHMGKMSLREALARSRNTAALQTLQAVEKEVGLDKAKEFVNNLGIDMDEVYESSAIGTEEVSSLEMAGAYSAFGNEGFYTEPHSIKKIEMRDKTTIDARIIDIIMIIKSGIAAKIFIKKLNILVSRKRLRKIPNSKLMAMLAFTPISMTFKLVKKLSPISCSMSLTCVPNWYDD